MKTVNVYFSPFGEVALKGGSGEMRQWIETVTSTMAPGVWTPYEIVRQEPVEFDESRALPLIEKASEQGGASFTLDLDTYEVTSHGV